MLDRLWIFLGEGKGRITPHLKGFEFVCNTKYPAQEIPFPYRDIIQRKTIELAGAENNIIKYNQYKD